ncbi:MAG: NAD(P)H-hydrate epimerase [Planctomycetales bacterium]|nr:NAD(P)H-hydrate epimerase [Planctomycetales bacterium]
MREVDRVAIEDLGIASIALMENAGRAVAEEAFRRLPTEGGAVAVVAGKGQNAGDGFVAARHLRGRGAAVEVWLAAGEPSGDAAQNLAVLRRLDVRVAPAGADLAERLAGAALVVDALLGTGAAGEVRGGIRAAIEAVNRCGRPVLAVDIPSGLDATSGEILGICVRAAATVTMAVEKRGFTRGVGPAHTGLVIVADIGIPPEALDRVLGPG